MVQAVEVDAVVDAVVAVASASVADPVLCRPSIHPMTAFS